MATTHANPAPGMLWQAGVGLLLAVFQYEYFGQVETFESQVLKIGVTFTTILLIVSLVQSYIAQLQLGVKGSQPELVTPVTFFEGLNKHGLLWIFVLELTACLVHPLPFVPVPRWVSIVMFVRLYLLLRFVRSVTPLSKDGRYLRAATSGKKKSSTTARRVWYFPAFPTVLADQASRVTIACVILCFLSVAYIARVATGVHTFTWWICVLFPVSGLFASIVSATNFVLLEDTVAKKLKPHLDDEDRRSRDLQAAIKAKKEALAQSSAVSASLKTEQKAHAQLRSKFESTSKEVSTLTNRLTVAQRESGRLADRNRDLGDRTAELKKQLSQTVQQLEEVEADRVRLRNKEEEVNARSVRMRASQAEFDSKMAEVRGTAVKAQAEGNAAASKVKELENELAKSRAEVASLQSLVKSNGAGAKGKGGGNRKGASTTSSANTNANARLSHEQSEELTALRDIVRDRDQKVKDLETELAHAKEASKGSEHKDSEIVHLKKAVKDARHQSQAGLKAIDELKSLRAELARMNTEGSSGGDGDDSKPVIPEALVFENRDLKKRIHNLEEIKAALEKEKEDMRIAAKFTGAAAVQSLKTVQAQVASLRSELARVKEDKAVSDSSARSSDEVEALRVANAQLSMKAESLEGKVSDLGKEINSLSAELETAREAAAAAPTNTSTAADLNVSAVSHASTADLDVSNNRLEETVSLLAGRLDELSGIIEDQERDTETLESNLRRAEQEASTLREENEKLVERVRTQQLTVGAADTSAEATSPLVSIHRQLTELTQELRSATATPNAKGDNAIVAPSPLVMDLEQVVRRVEDRTQDVCRQLESVTGFNADTGENTSETGDLKRRLDAETQQRVKFEDELSQSSNVIAELRKEVADAKQTATSVGSQFREEEEKSRALARDLERFTESLASQKVVIEKLQSEITSLRATADAHEQMTSHLPGLEHHVRSLESDRARLADQVESLESEVTRLRNASSGSDSDPSTPSSTAAAVNDSDANGVHSGPSSNGRASAGGLDSAVERDVAKLTPYLRDHIPSNFARVGETSTYSFGTMQVVLQTGGAADAPVLVRVAGGQMSLADFIGKYGPTESSKLARRGAPPAPVGVGGLSPAAYASPPVRTNGFG